MEIKRVGVIGAGQMGAGIAQVCASIGKVVTLCDIKQEFIDGGLASIIKNLQRNVSKDRISQNQMNDTIGNVRTSLENESLSNCDIVIEAIIEDVDILSMGGSRTNDAGIGLLSKMGIDFLNNKDVIEDPKPKDFKLINNIKINESFKKVNKKVLIDTNIPLLGDNNAFKVFGPQKGLANSEIKFLEKNVERILNLLSNEMDSSLDPFKEGTGASGGLSFALGEVLGCEIISGPQFFLNETKLLNKINDFEIAILCEGKFDFSSMNGKVLGEILKLHTGKTYFLGGKFDYNDENIFTDIFELGNKGMKNSKKVLRDSAYILAKKIGK